MTYHEERMGKIPTLDNDELLKEFKFSMLHTKVLTAVADKQADKLGTYTNNLSFNQVVEAIKVTKEYSNGLETEIRKRMVSL